MKKVAALALILTLLVGGILALSGPSRAIIDASGVGLASPDPSEPPILADQLVVDKTERTLTAYRDGEVIRTYRSIQFGDEPRGHKRFEGDERTPEGRYTIDARNPESRYHLSLRISYPNREDRDFAAQQRQSPGGDIFIHGQPNGMPLGRMPGDWTDGCIALSNTEMEELWQLVPDGTPIEIVP